MAEIVFRADASLQMGTGHVMRCLTLAGELHGRGHRVGFLCRALEGHLAARIEAAGFPVDLLPAPDGVFFPEDGAPAHAEWAGVPWQLDVEECVTALKGRRPDWIVVDHYAFDAAWQREMAGHAGRVMVWDDLADRHHDCALLVDQNLGRAPDSYADLVPPGTPVLAGPAYATLRPEFAALRADTLAARQARGLRRIMISMGGVDADNATGRILEVLERIPALRDVGVEVILGARAPALDAVRAQAEASALTVEVAVDVTDMARRMAEADLAIGAVGGTTWERCALGLPGLLLTIADNQRPAADAIHATGAAVLLGDLADPDWPARLSDWLSHPDLEARLPAMSTAAAAICDGEGAARLADAMDRPRLHFRDAGMADAAPIHDWRYGAGPDRFSRSGETPTLDAHKAWLSRALGDPARRIRVLEVAGKPLGYIRLDLEDGRATVSLCLAPEGRGQGLGASLLQEARRLADLAGLAALDAQVHVENVASLRLFDAAGYRRGARDGAFQHYHCDLRGQNAGHHD